MRFPCGANFCLSCGEFRRGFEHTQYSDRVSEGTVDERIEECGLRQVREYTARRVTAVTAFALWVWVFLSVTEGAVFILAPEAVAGSYLFSETLLFEGLIMLSSGVCALIGALFCRRKGQWNIVAAACATASIIPLMLVPAGDIAGLLYASVGLAVTLRVVRTRWASARLA